MLGQEAGDPGHAPDVFEQPRGIAMVEVLGGGHLLEQRGVLVQEVANQAIQARIVDVAFEIHHQLWLADPVRERAQDDDVLVGRH